MIIEPLYSPTSEDHFHILKLLHQLTNNKVVESLEHLKTVCSGGGTNENRLFVARKKTQKDTDDKDLV